MKVFLILFTIINISGINNPITDSQPGFSLPKPTGTYAVGTRYFYFIDQSRPDTYSSDPDDYRWMSLQVWYPAKPKPDMKPLPYSDRESTESFVKMGFFHPSFIDDFALRPTHSYLNAPFVETKELFPVILYSSSGVMTANTFLFEELASHGYVVFSIGHPYWCEFYFDAEGKKFRFDKENKYYKEMWKEEGSSAVNETKEKITRAITLNDKLKFQRQLNQLMPTEVSDLLFWSGDIGFVIEELRKMNLGDGFFKGKLDIDRIGIMGYSKGGAAAGQFCVTDKRCQAGINLGGFMFGDIVEKNLARPFMFMESEESWCQDCLPINDLFYHQAKSSVFMVKIKGSRHGNFTDLSLAKNFIMSDGVVGPIDGSKFLQIQNDYVLQFFNKYLKDLPAPLLDGSSSKYPEVIFKSRVNKYVEKGTVLVFMKYRPLFFL